MSSTDIRYVSISRIVGIYMAWYIGFVTSLAILRHFSFERALTLGYFLGAASPAAFGAAWYWLKQEKAKPASRRIWTYALICWVVCTTLLFVLVAAGVVRDDGWDLLTLVSLFNMLLTRFVFWLVFEYPPRIPKNLQPSRQQQLPLKTQKSRMRAIIAHLQSGRRTSRR